VKVPVLSVKQPWAWLIVTGHKTCENRSWTMKHRGKVMIHVSRDLRTLFEDVRWVREEFGIQVPLEEMEVGKVIGSVELVDVVQESEDPWFAGPNGFLLEKPRMLPAKKRFALRGQPGVFYLDTTGTTAKAKRPKSLDPQEGGKTPSPTLGIPDVSSCKSEAEIPPDQPGPTPKAG
jgi:hypothetical protein